MTREPAEVPQMTAEETVRLRSFAMLVSRGDQHAALAAWRKALDAGTRRRRPLAHPAGWLRRRVLRELDGGFRQRVERLLPATDEAFDVERRATLRALGASDAVIAGLWSLSPTDRAAVVAHAVERLDPVDVGEALGLRERGTRRVVARAMRRYLRGANAMLAEEPWARRQASGDIADRVAAAAEQAVDAGPTPA
jgi:DNA-directed RNA polymerase specialized sigma24 family protein